MSIKHHLAMTCLLAAFVGACAAPTGVSFGQGDVGDGDSPSDSDTDDDGGSSSSSGSDGFDGSGGSGGGSGSSGGGGGSSSGGGGSQCWIESGNPSCGSLALGIDVLTIEKIRSGSYGYGQGDSVSLMLADDHLGFTSTGGIAAMIVKGGPSATVCSYVPATQEDYGLHAPINLHTASPYAISHISFCE